jgi:signal transduction histidine kinase
MPSRSPHSTKRRSSTDLRVKIAALLLSLIALWAFAAAVTLREGTNLLWLQTVDSKIIRPSEPLLLQLTQERRQTLVYLGRPSLQDRDSLATERQETDNLAAAFKESAQGWQARMAASAAAKQRLSEVLADLDALAATRQKVDGGSGAITRAAAAATFSSAVESLNRLYDAAGSLDDKATAHDTAVLIQMYRVRELMSQEDALLAGVTAAGQITPAEHAQFVQLVGTQRWLAGETATQLRPEDKAKYDEVLAGTAFGRWRSGELRIIDGTRDGRPAVSSQEWAAAGAALTDLQEMVLSSGRALVDRSTPVGIWVMIRFVLLFILGLFAVIASIVISVTTARALVAQLERLRNAAHDLADERLPNVVVRLGRGEQVDVAAEAPPLDFGDDEIGQVGQAFNRVQETAVRTAVEQAELRRSVRDVFLSLARRTQALVHRQVTLLTQLQQGELPPEQLEGLYAVDHLATRMRRNAENLIVLSGSTPGRAWRRNIAMVDVIRAAMQEVEDYTRVNVLPIGSVGLAGRAVSDVIHLLAELIENALSFSPPHTGVEIKGQMVANGYVIEIEDRGLGMAEEDFAAANAQIASEQEFNLANATRLGLFVVSRLTHRHGVRVQLKASPYGGTTAVVLIPLDLVTDSAGESGTSGTTGLNGRVPGDSGRAPEAPLPSRAARPVAVAEPTQSAVDAPTATPGRPPLHRREPRHQGWKNLSPSIPPEPYSTVNTDEPPPAPTTESAASHTPSGLPFRVRQASLAPPLREQSPAANEAPTDDDDTPRPPDQVRRIMSSYQSGTRRGRTDAARLLNEDNDEPSAPAPGPEDWPGDQRLT